MARTWKPEDTPQYTRLVENLRSNPKVLTLEKGLCGHVVRAIAFALGQWSELTHDQQERVLIAAIATVLEEQGMVSDAV